MYSLSSELARFVLDMKYSDLPDNVVHETKRVILDSIACGLVGQFCERGQCVIEYCKSIGGNPESSIIGTSYKVPSAVSAFANGELINAMDFDAFEIPPGHFPPFVVPAALAIAEHIEASGKELISAVALGSEIGSRVAGALVSMKGTVENEPGPVVLTSGQSMFIFGSLVAAAKLLKLNVETCTQAMGLAGHFCPLPNNRKFQVTAPSPMTRLTGWVAQAAVTAALLARTGYAGDANIFDGEYGFWRMYACEAWHPDLVLETIGKNWLFLNVGYKLYPCHRALNSALDCFISIIN